MTDMNKRAWRAALRRRRKQEALQKQQTECPEAEVAVSTADNVTQAELSIDDDINGNVMQAEDLGEIPATEEDIDENVILVELERQPFEQRQPIGTVQKNPNHLIFPDEDEVEYQDDIR